MPGAKQAQIEPERTALLQRQVDLARTGRKPLVQVPHTPCDMCTEASLHATLQPQHSVCCALQPQAASRG